MSLIACQTYLIDILIEDTGPRGALERKSKNDLGFVSRLSEQQQNQYVPLDDMAPLPSADAQLQAMLRLKKRFESFARHSTHSSDARPAKQSRRPDKEYSQSAFLVTAHGGIPPPAVNPEDSRYIVERLLESRLGGRNRRTVMQFLVKWEGYREEHNSWVDENNVRRTEQKDISPSFLGLAVFSP
ncbi:hypothetical protein V2W45_1438577 [Cenococcum geophilum]